MSYEKTILCLANSRKISGRCIAGKEIKGKSFGDWIRPVSAREKGEISEDERRYENGQTAQLLDIVSIPCVSAQPHSCQSENHLIDEQQYWKKVGQATWSDLGKTLDKVPGILWINSSSSHNGVNDEITLAQANELKNSLVFVKPEHLVLFVAPEGFQTVKLKVRAQFQINSVQYKLAVTDPVIEQEYIARRAGTYPVEEAYMCVSIGEPIGGNCYKLVASVITPDRAGVKR